MLPEIRPLHPKRHLPDIFRMNETETLMPKLRFQLYCERTEE